MFKDTAHNMTRSCEQQVEVQASTEVATVNNDLSSFALCIPVGVPGKYMENNLMECFISTSGFSNKRSVKNYVGISCPVNKLVLETGLNFWPTLGHPLFTLRTTVTFEILYLWHAAIIILPP